MKKDFVGEFRFKLSGASNKQQETEMEKLLIIDDNRLETCILNDILGEDYNIITANTGKKGLEKAMEEVPAIILLDIVMPGMDGFEILKHLKDNELTKDIPVIFLTGLTDEKTEEKGFLNGVIDYIRKPYNPNIVRARVWRHVQLHLYMKTIESKMQLDGLTGLYNRSAFETKLQTWWDKAKKQCVPISFCIVDIDYFKMVNDTYGHGEGDNVLRKTAKVMESKFSKENQFVARYGGEEFVIVLYNIGEEEGKTLAEELRISIKNLNIPNCNSKVASVLTASIGGRTEIPSQYSSIEFMIEAADKMLYKAKDNGRNQVCWSS